MEHDKVSSASGKNVREAGPNPTTAFGTAFESSRISSPIDTLLLKNWASNGII